jgi:hypothetical protein
MLERLGGTVLCLGVARFFLPRTLPAKKALTSCDGSMGGGDGGGVSCDSSYTSDRRTGSERPPRGPHAAAGGRRSGVGEAERMESGESAAGGGDTWCGEAIPAPCSRASDHGAHQSRWEAFFLVPDALKPVPGPSSLQRSPSGLKAPEGLGLSIFPGYGLRQCGTTPVHNYAPTASDHAHTGIRTRIERPLRGSALPGFGLGRAGYLVRRWWWPSEWWVCQRGQASAAGTRIQSCAGTRTHARTVEWRGWRPVCEARKGDDRDPAVAVATRSWHGRQLRQVCCTPTTL